jgi:prevent-host-death family protein
MPNIKPISELRNNANEISEYCHNFQEPVFITKNGTGDLVVLSIEEYEKQQALISIYEKLAIADAEADAGLGEDFFTFETKLREKLHGGI